MKLFLPFVRVEDENGYGNACIRHYTWYNVTWVRKLHFFSSFTFSTNIFSLIGVVINVLCCSDDYNDEDRRENELTRYDTGLPAEKEPTLAM